MSLWMNAGTIAVTINSKKVTGTGTAFATSAIPARPGQPIIINNVFYEIESVESDTVLWLAANYVAASATGVKYSVMTTMEGSFNDLARRAAQVMGAYQGYMDVYNDLFTGTGLVHVVLPDGSEIDLPAWATMATEAEVDALRASVDTEVDALSASVSALSSSLTSLTNKTLKLSGRNILINGQVVLVNQRRFDGNWASLSVGAYGYDRWKKASASDMSQVVESGNFALGAKYTLSGIGVTTAILTAPASGHWTITVPQSARNIQLEPGEFQTPFEIRDITTETLLCQRYCLRMESTTILSETIGVGGYCTGTVIISQYHTPVEMRTDPTYAGGGVLMLSSPAGNVSIAALTKRGCSIVIASNSQTNTPGHSAFLMSSGANSGFRGFVCEL